MLKDFLIGTYGKLLQVIFMIVGLLLIFGGLFGDSTVAVVLGIVFLCVEMVVRYALAGIFRMRFIITWLVILLLAPSIWFHRLGMEGAPPPGSDIEPPSLFIPFGVVHFGRSIVEQLLGGDFMDALMILLFQILPIVVYTLVLSSVIYYSFRKVRHRFSG